MKIQIFKVIVSGKYIKFYIIIKYIFTSIILIISSLLISPFLSISYLFVLNHSSKFIFKIIYILNIQKLNNYILNAHSNLNRKILEKYFILFFV